MAAVPEEQASLPVLPESEDQSHSPARLESGFTIVELMLTLVLLWILATLAYVSYGKYLDKVRNAQAIGDIATMGAAIQQYSVDAHAYPLSLDEVGYGGKKDPWGNPYVYYNVEVNGKGGSRKDHALNPLNTDFDLYSKGPDGLTSKQITQKSSLDDIIRAGNGSFVGVAADF